jgi:hypothetical protein
MTISLGGGGGRGGMSGMNVNMSCNEVSVNWADAGSVKGTISEEFGVIKVALYLELSEPR